MNTKTMIVSVLAGLALVGPAVAYAQSDNEAALSSDARYCSMLQRGYVAAHPNMLLSDGTIAQPADCAGDPEGTIANLTAQMHEENMPVPPRP